MTLMIIKDEVFLCVYICVCVELGCVSMWCETTTILMNFFFFMASEFFFPSGFLSKSFSEVKHVTRKHCALNILSGRSGGQ